MKPIKIIFDDISKIANLGQVVSKSIASWIIVSSKCVDGLSNGNLLFSASKIANKFIAIKQRKKSNNAQELDEINLEIEIKSIFHQETTINHKINKIVTGSTIAKTKASLAHQSHQK